MKKITLVFPFLIAVIFPMLFHHQQAGVNLLLFDVLILALLSWSGRASFSNTLSIMLFAGVVISGVAVILYGSAMSVAVNVISLILLSGLLAAPYLSVLANGFLTTFISLFTAPFNYIRQLGSLSGTNNRSRMLLRYIGYTVVPVIVLVIFISLYSAASPYFNRITGNFVHVLNVFFTNLFTWIHPETFWLAVAGFVIAVILFYGKMSGFFDLPGEAGVQDLSRIKRWYKGSPVGLRTELRTAILMFGLLNVVLVVMNALDLWYVWINFKWDGGFLKQFVHEGTWLLILSIVISMILVLWYFRGNLNFYPKNRTLILLTRVWIAQNLFLALSVAMRNFWYLHYFNLAYKRIWVYAFLILVIVGLITVLIKVNKRKTLKYLLVRNSVYAYIVFTALSLLNWDVVIAKFNVNRAEKAFYHTDFMAYLNNSALPVLIMDEQKLNRVSEAQSKMFTFHENYMTFEDYNKTLQWRKEQFLKEYPETHWLSWNLADWNAYRKLK